MCQAQAEHCNRRRQTHLSTPPLDPEVELVAEECWLVRSGDSWIRDPAGVIQRRKHDVSGARSVGGGDASTNATCMCTFPKTAETMHFREESPVTAARGAARMWGGGGGGGLTSARACASPAAVPSEEGVCTDEECARIEPTTQGTQRMCKSTFPTLVMRGHQ